MPVIVYRGSLAERLQTLINREKSAKAVWAHSLRSKQKESKGIQ